MKFKETSIPQMYSEALSRMSPPYIVGPEASGMIYEILMTSMSDYLKLVSSTNNKTALSFEDAAGNMYFAGLVQHHEGEEGMPGNFSYTITTDKADLEGFKVYTVSDPNYLQLVSSTAHSMHGMLFNVQSYIIILFNQAAKTLLEWLDVNASDKEEKEVVLDGFFTASVAVEDGEKVSSIIPDGAMKRLIKNDTSIEQ